MKLLTYIIVVLFFLLSLSSNAQLEFLKKKVTKEIEKQFEEKEKSKENQKTESKKDTLANKELTQTNDLQSYSKFDFVPGEKVILFEDFSQDAVGDFPALWTANAPGEINTLNIAPGHWFNLNSGEGNYSFLQNVNFPTNFIVEFDIVPKKTGGRIAAGILLYQENKHLELDNNYNSGVSGLQISIEKESWNTMGYKAGENVKITGSSKINPVVPEKVNHVIIWVQNRRLRIYQKGAKVLDMPTNIYEGTKFNRFGFRLSRGASCGSYISNIRITDAAPDMRSKLLTEGKLVSYGIYFDVNKDIVKPESYGTLKGIADILNENPSIRIKVVGHTDSDGNDASNLDLSKRRAESVKNNLVKTFGIEPSRIEFDGMGETQPIAPNDNVSNKALNRRVEFVKL